MRMYLYDKKVSMRYKSTHMSYEFYTYTCIYELQMYLRVAKLTMRYKSVLQINYYIF